MAVIEAEGLRKTYARRGGITVEAVRGVDLRIEPGEVFALLGPNGAGKTTTLEILEGYRERTAGQVRVLGVDPASGGRRLHQRVGIVLQDLAVEPYLSVREILSHYARFYPHPRPVADVIELVGLGAKADARARTLSGGQQRRLDLALGILGRPELLFLDEPTTGFDPSARRESWDVVRELCAGGTTVLLTTHYMDEAQALADRVAVISGGRIVAEGAPGSLGGRDSAAVRIRFSLPAEVIIAELPVPPASVSRLAADDPVVRRAETPRVTVSAPAGEETRVLHQLTGWALDRGLTLTGLTVDRPSLEDTYLALTGQVARPEDEEVAA